MDKNDTGSGTREPAMEGPKEQEQKTDSKLNCAAEQIRLEKKVDLFEFKKAEPNNPYTETHTETYEKSVPQGMGMYLLKVPNAWALLDEGKKHVGKLPHIIFVLDASGSMEGCWGYLAKACNSLMDRIQKKDPTLSCVRTFTFDHEVRVIPEKRVSTNIHECGGGSTSFLEPFNRIESELKNIPQNEEIKIIFGSDGQFDIRLHSFEILEAALGGLKDKNISFFCLAIGDDYPTRVANYLLQLYNHPVTNNELIFKVYHPQEEKEFDIEIRKIEKYLFKTKAEITTSTPLRASPMDAPATKFAEGTYILVDKPEVEFKLEDNAPKNIKAKEIPRVDEIAEMYRDWTYKIQVYASSKNTKKHIALKNAKELIETIKGLNHLYFQKTGIDLDAKTLDGMTKHYEKKDKIPANMFILSEVMKEIFWKLTIIHDSKFFDFKENEIVDTIGKKVGEELGIASAFKKAYKGEFDKMINAIVEKININKSEITEDKASQSTISGSLIGEVYNSLLCDIDVPSTQTVDESEEILNFIPRLGYCIVVESTSDPRRVKVTDASKIDQYRSNFEEPHENLPVLGKGEVLIPLFDKGDFLNRKADLKTKTDQFNQFIAADMKKDLENYSDELYLDTLFQTYTLLSKRITRDDAIEKLKVKEFKQKIFYSLKMMDHIKPIIESTKLLSRARFNESLSDEELAELVAFSRFVRTQENKLKEEMDAIKKESKILRK